MKRWDTAAVVAAVVVPGGGVAVLVWWLVRLRRERMLRDRLRNGLPLRVERWAPEIASAAIYSAPITVDLDKWAYAFAGIVDRESGGGVYLDTKGPDGVGDGGHGHGLGQVDDRPAKDDASDYEKALSVKRLAHIASGDWKDPRLHLRFCAREVFRGAWDQFSDVADEDARLAAAVAAYNAGVDNVRRQLDAGAPVDAVTTKGASGERDYSSDVLARADAWQTKASA